MVMMPVAMIVFMTVRVRLFMTVRVSMPGRISTCFRIEWRTNSMNVTTKTPYHVGNHMIVADQDAFLLDHGWKMPVSQMPRHTQQMQRAMTVYFQQVFLLRFDPHDVAVFQQQSVACAEQASMLQIEQHPLA